MQMQVFLEEHKYLTQPRIHLSDSLLWIWPLYGFLHERTSSVDSFLLNQDFL